MFVDIKVIYSVLAIVDYPHYRQDRPIPWGKFRQTVQIHGGSHAKLAIRDRKKLFSEAWGILRCSSYALFFSHFENFRKMFANECLIFRLGEADVKD